MFGAVEVAVDVAGEVAVDRWDSCTPPGRYRSGSTWPGRTKSCGSLSPAASRRSVIALSDAEMPVVVPSAASTVMVYAVRIGSVLTDTINGKANSSRRSPKSGAQSTPEV